MRIAINLASEPFRRDRPMVAASVVVGLVLCGTLALFLALAFMERGTAAQTRQDIARLDRRIVALNGEQARLEAALRRPENAEVLSKVLFINSLLYRKGISWTKIFSDLEGVMPHNVRLISIRPQVEARDDVLLDMVVGAQSQLPVIEMLKRLENSPMFGSTEVHNTLPPSQTEPLWRGRITVSYGQRL
jgi:type IV pilus assembly protein PilN